MILEMSEVSYKVELLSKLSVNAFISLAVLQITPSYHIRKRLGYFELVSLCVVIFSAQPHTLIVYTLLYLR